MSMVDLQVPKVLPDVSPQQWPSPGTGPSPFSQHPMNGLCRGESGPSPGRL